MLHTLLPSPWVGCVHCTICNGMQYNFQWLQHRRRGLILPARWLLATNTFTPVCRAFGKGASMGAGRQGGKSEMSSGQTLTQAEAAMVYWQRKVL
jgi:hypothetical protein